MTIEDGNLLL